MDVEFKRQMEYCNIPAWHEKGYTGKGITVFMDDLTERNHNKLTQMVVQTILPDALVLTGTIGTTIVEGKVANASITCYETSEIMSFEDFIKKYKVGLINNSKNNGTHDADNPKAVWLREMRDKHNFILTGSAGNGYGCPIDNSYYGAGIIITGVNSKKKSTYAEDDIIDFTCYTAGMAGTSFAAPFFAGMAGLLKCKNPRINQQDVIDYFSKHCEGLGAKGKDKVYGRGLAKMGEPIKTIVIPIGEDCMTVDGLDVKLEQPAIIDKKTNRTLVPLRAISEALGASVVWDNNTRSVVIKL
jgi:hypothetical protein